MHKTKIKKSTWKTVATRPISNFDSINYKELKEWIEENIPIGIDYNNINLSFTLEAEPTYYDDYILSGEMSLSFKDNRYD